MLRRRTSFAVRATGLRCRRSGADVDVNVAYPCISIAASSHLSPALAVQAHDTEPGDACAFELDAPVTAPGMLMAQLFAQVGEPSVTSPYIEGDSRTLLLGNCVVIDTAGCPRCRGPSRW